MREKWQTCPEHLLCARHWGTLAHFILINPDLQMRKLWHRRQRNLFKIRKLESWSWTQVCLDLRPELITILGTGSNMRYGGHKTPRFGSGPCSWVCFGLVPCSLYLSFFISKMGLSFLQTSKSCTCWELWPGPGGAGAGEQVERGSRKIWVVKQGAIRGVHPSPLCHDPEVRQHRHWSQATGRQSSRHWKLQDNNMALSPSPARTSRSYCWASARRRPGAVR